MERITIIGLGPIGVSMGMALAQANLRNTEVVGTTGDRGLLGNVAKLKVFDKTETRLGTAIEGASLIVFDSPLSEMRELMEAVGPYVQDGAVVIDTGPVKGLVAKWAKEHFPPSVHYVPSRPLLKKPLASLADADPKVFVGATYALMPASDTPSSALETVVGYVETLGAQPAFMDREEYDSYSAAVSQLPVVVSCALMTTASGSESWREMHRVASAEFARLTELASEDPEATEVSCLANADSLVHWIDQLITELYAYRNQIKEGNDDLIENLVRAWEGRARWDADAVASNPGERMMSARESMSTAFLGERLTKRLAGIDADKKEPWKYKRRF